MSVGSEAVKRWRRNTKQRMIDAMGGSCAICGYDRCPEAMDFHHLDPTKKDIALGGIRANPVSWERLTAELRKCVLLCATCHREHHAGIVSIPQDIKSFDETFADYKLIERTAKMNHCPVCEKLKSEASVTCSRACAAKQKGKIDWDKYDVPALCHGQSYEAVGRLLGCTGAAVKKRLLKLSAAPKVAR